MNNSTIFSSGSKSRCSYVYFSWSSISLLTLPIFLSVIVLAILTCRTSKSSSASHSDIFTFNLAAMEVIGVMAVCSLLIYFSTLVPSLSIVSDNLLYISTTGQALFHLLVCTERYFAVVHPVTYLHLKKKANFIRDSCIVTVWLYSFGMSCMYHFKDSVFIPYVVLFSGLTILLLISFFCASVLRVLIRPGPGERGGHKRRVDQSKCRAFYTMLAITGSLLLKFVALFAWLPDINKNMTEENRCLLVFSSLWFNIPSSLILPVLLLHRRMKDRKTKK